MIATDEDALICDLAETYGIYDYKALPATRVALFAVGLRPDSRVKMKLADMKYQLETLLMAAMVDRLSMLMWAKTKDAEHGTNRPDLITEKLLGAGSRTDILSFDTVEEFEKQRQRIRKGGG